MPPRYCKLEYPYNDELHRAGSDTTNDNNDDEGGQGEAGRGRGVEGEEGGGRQGAEGC